MLRPHPFYALPPPLRAPLALVLAVLAVAPLGTLVVEPLAWLALPLMASWAFFATTPLLRAVGFYRYYSPYLCAMLPTARRLDVHLGTSFDHLLTLRPGDAGAQARARLLVGALEGLIAIAEEVDAGTLPPDITVEGTSWFFTPSTVHRLGFETTPPTWFGRVVPFVIALDIIAMASFTRGRLTWPRITQVRRAVTTGARLSAHRARLLALRDRLARPIRVARPLPIAR